ncbi:TetR/AcrR family transcriptional regulator C-terminal domain-containing protein [Micromonospora sp. NBC_01699]|uniref:TetR/AcrR family transcriptional regulator C-terminal domain-containing protein n=1 Tax=Micromonospora sp. NBC_01699 TaxID=2975984 RepID=UPI002E2935D2|nr:TetR/AcrR family transcriptional regulator C-terminal domain-containing protein [Micromonospora sp. NBC_01699]
MAPNAASPPDPPYLRIVARLRDRITSGQLRPGDRVPSTRQIMAEHGVAMATASKVLAALRQEGLVSTSAGSGTVVSASAPPDAPARTVRHRRARETEQELSTERIVARAVDIADREGLAALSLRRISAELDVATMSLYRYVDSKDDLVLLMAEAAFGETALPDPPPADWRSRLKLISQLQWSIHRRHPWLVHVMSLTRPQPSPHALAHTEWALRALDGVGLDPMTILYVHITTFSYVRGFAVNFELEAEALQNTGITDEQWLKSQDDTLAGMLASGSFPMLERTTSQDNFHFSVDQIFEFGLDLVLDGVATRIATRRAG